MTRLVRLTLAVSCVFAFCFFLSSCSSGGGSSTTGGGGNIGGGGQTTDQPAVTTTALPAGTIGVAYSTTLTAAKGTAPYTWTLKSGALPAGLTLTSAGVISGTPSAIGTASALVFQVTDAESVTAVSSSLSIVINPTALVVSTSNLAAGTVGAAYSAQLSATGGVAPYSWTLSGTLPAGLAISSSGLISGTPTAAGTTTGLTFHVTDSNQDSASSIALTLQINPAALVVATTSLPVGTVGVTYSAAVQATGGTPPYSWMLLSGTLPAGLTLNSAGVIAGKPTTPGASGPLVFQVADSKTVTANSVAIILTIDSALAIGTSALPSGTVGTSYSTALAATGGSGSYTWTLFSGTLPPGLTLAASGTISGTPTAPGTFSPLVFQVSDTIGNTLQSSPLSLQVYNAQGCSAGSELLFGTQPYAFLLKGFSAAGVPETIAGSFTPDGAGNITAGEEDDNNAAASTNMPLITANSSYTLGADNRGCINLATSSGTRTFYYSLTPSNGGGILIEADATVTRGTGILRVQSPGAFSTGLTGPYALLLSGLDSTGGRFGLVGSLSASSLAFSTVALETDDAGVLACNDGNPPYLTRCSTSVGSGTFTAADSSGRGTATLDALFSKSNYSANYVYYVVSTTEAIFASSDPVTANPVISGEALGTTGVYSAADLTGTFIGHGVGLANNDLPIASLAIGSFDGVKVMSAGTLSRDQAGSLPKYAFSGGYLVDSITGRIWFKDEKVIVSGQIVNSYNGVSALVLGDDPQATTGMVEAQTATAPASGDFALGTEEDADYATANQIGIVGLGPSSFSGTENLSDASGLTLNQLIPATDFTFGANGSGNFGTGTTNLALTDGNAIYFIDESAGVTHPVITVVTK